MRTDRLHRWEVRFGWLLLAVSILGWPISALTWAKDEPATVLALSWIAIAFTAWDIVKTSRIHAGTDKETAPG